MGKFAGLQNLATRIADLDPRADYPQNGNGSSPSFEIATNSGSSQLSTAGLKTLPLSSIVVSSRIRQHLDAEKTESLAHSIQQHGFRGVLWVRQIGDSYHLIAGGRRYAACQLAGVTEVPVEVWDVTDAEAIQLELLENFQREDLNPIEEAEGVLKMLEVTLEMERAEVIALLRRKGRNEADLESGDNVVPTSEKELFSQIDQVFALIGKYSPESFRTHRLPLLSLPQPLIEAISDGKLEYTKARVIARIKDPEYRDSVLEQAISQELSHTEINDLVKQIQTEVQTVAELPPVRQIYGRAQDITRRIRSARLEGRKLKKLTKLLEQIEQLLSED